MKTKLQRLTQNGFSMLESIISMGLLSGAISIMFMVTKQGGDEGKINRFINRKYQLKNEISATLNNLAACNRTFTAPVAAGTALNNIYKDASGTVAYTTNGTYYDIKITSMIIEKHASSSQYFLKANIVDAAIGGSSKAGNINIDIPGYENSGNMLASCYNDLEQMKKTADIAVCAHFSGTLDLNGVCQTRKGDSVDVCVSGNCSSVKDHIAAVIAANPVEFTLYSEINYTGSKKVVKIGDLTNYMHQTASVGRSWYYKSLKINFVDGSTGSDVEISSNYNGNWYRRTRTIHGQGIPDIDKYISRDPTLRLDTGLFYGFFTTNWNHWSGDNYIKVLVKVSTSPPEALVKYYTGVDCTGTSITQTASEQINWSWRWTTNTPATIFYNSLEIISPNVTSVNWGHYYFGNYDTYSRAVPAVTAGKCNNNPSIPNIDQYIKNDSTFATNYKWVGYDHWDGYWELKVNGNPVWR